MIVSCPLHLQPPIFLSIRMLLVSSAQPRRTTSWPLLFLCCCCMIMSSLWIWRSSGFGRSSISFAPTHYALTPAPSLRWRLPKILFIINRYIITVLLLLDCLPELIYPVFVSFCNFHLVLWVCVPILNFGAAELLVILRVSSLYGHSKVTIRLD